MTTLATVIPFGHRPEDPRIRAVEWAVAATLWAYLFLLIVMLVIGRSVGSALFLNHFDGPGLAVVYVLVGMTLPAMVWLVDRLGRGQPHLAVTAWTLVLFLLSCFAIRSLLASEFRSPIANASIILGLIYLVIESFAFLTTVQFWANANAALSPRQAKRYYAFVGTGGIFGSIAGGFWVRTHAKQSVDATLESIVFLVPVELLLLAVLSFLLVLLHRVRPKLAEHWNTEQTSPERAPERPYRPLALGMGMVACLAVFSTTLIDYYYKTFADISFSGNVQKLTAFFGGFYLCVGICTLLAQFFITTMILKRFQSFVGMGLSPLSLIGLTVLNALFPNLWSVAVFKLVDSALSHSVYRSCQEFLYTPLPTGWVRSLKSTSEGFWGRCGLLLAGGFLLALVGLFGTDSPRWLLGSIVLSLFGWGMAIAYLRRQFPETAEVADEPPIRRTLHWDDLKDDSGSRKVA